MKDVEQRVRELVEMARRRRKLRDQDSLFLLTIPYRTDTEREYLEKLRPILQKRHNISSVKLVRDDALHPMTLMLQVSADAHRVSLPEHTDG